MFMHTRGIHLKHVDSKTLYNYIAMMGSYSISIVGDHPNQSFTFNKGCQHIASYRVWPCMYMYIQLHGLFFFISPNSIAKF